MWFRLLALVVLLCSTAQAELQAAGWSQLVDEPGQWQTQGSMRSAMKWGRRLFPEDRPRQRLRRDMAPNGKARGGRPRQKKGMWARVARPKGRSRGEGERERRSRDEMKWKIHPRLDLICLMCVSSSHGTILSRLVAYSLTVVPCSFAAFCVFFSF